MKIYATYNIKGGVGKTTAAVNLAYLSASGDQRTLLWDLDPQGAASFLFRIKPRVKGGGKGLIRGTKTMDGAVKGTDFHHLDLLPADFTYRNMDLLLGGADKKPTRKIGQLLRPLAAEYDNLFLDCPPSISLVSENVMHAADVLLVPLIPTTLSVRTLDQLTDFVSDFNGRRPQVCAFFSMVDRRKKLHQEITRNLSSERTGVAATAIPALSVIERMSVERAPVTVFAPRSQAARAFRALWSELTSAASDASNPGIALSLPALPGGDAGLVALGVRIHLLEPDRRALAERVDQRVPRAGPTGLVWPATLPRIAEEAARARPRRFRRSHGM